MKDLMIRYESTNGEKRYDEYDTIMDFVDAMESDGVVVPEMEIDNIAADFFENPLLHKRFNTLSELYEHCKAILK